MSTVDSCPQTGIVLHGMKSFLNLLPLSCNLLGRSGKQTGQDNKNTAFRRMTWNREVTDMQKLPVIGTSGQCSVLTLVATKLIL